MSQFFIIMNKEIIPISDLKAMNLNIAKLAANRNIRTKVVAKKRKASMRTDRQFPQSS